MRTDNNHRYLGVEDTLSSSLIKGLEQSEGRALCDGARERERDTREGET
jgi:hypothetical protein